MSAKVWQREPGTTSLSFIQAGKFWLILIKSLQYNLIFLNLDHNLLQKNKEKSKVILHVAHIQSSQA